MNLAEIVIRKVQSDSGLEVLQLLTESISKPCQTAAVCSHCEVLLFDIRCRDKARAWIALYMFFPYFNYLTGAILTLRLKYIGVVEGFYDLSIVNITAKATFNSLTID